MDTSRSKPRRTLPAPLQMAPHTYQHRRQHKTPVGLRQPSPPAELVNQDYRDTLGHDHPIPAPLCPSCPTVPVHGRGRVYIKREEDTRVNRACVLRIARAYRVISGKFADPLLSQDSLGQKSRFLLPPTARPDDGSSAAASAGRRSGPHCAAGASGRSKPVCWTWIRSERAMRKRACFTQNPFCPAAGFARHKQTIACAQ